MGKLLEMRGVSKRFPGVVALSGVDLDLDGGEVHVLLGENGAGKSTLIKILAGVHAPDEGVVAIDGREVKIRSTLAAQELGIATIHQELNLVPRLSVAENVLLGRQPRRFGIIDEAEMNRKAGELLRRLGVDVAPEEPVAQLGVAKQQMVEIAKALSIDARILVMDEPTAALSDGEVKALFEAVRRLQEDGVGVIFISHRLEEISEIGDRVTVLRDGRVVGTKPANANRDELIKMMVGRSVETQYPRRTSTEPGEPLLTVEHLVRRGALHDISFDLRAGEILGVAGLIGSGRTELARAIFGADTYNEGRVRVEGHDIRAGDINGARACGIGLVPEDRQGQGLVLPSSVKANLSLVTLNEDSSHGLIDDAKLVKDAERMVEELSIRTSGLDQQALLLSGGNQQKVVIGKWLLAESRILILDEPTRGIDVGAKSEIYELMNELTRLGAGILMISSDLREILGMSDRILVMREGRITGELEREEASEEKIMRLATQETEAGVG